MVVAVVPRSEGSDAERGKSCSGTAKQGKARPGRSGAGSNAIKELRVIPQSKVSTHQRRSGKVPLHFIKRGCGSELFRDGCGKT